MSSFPSLFISHGSPDLPLTPSAAQDFLSQLSQQFEKPKAILVISAHWNTTHPVVSASTQPETIHDFSGFPSALYQLQYPAPGAPQLAHRVHTLLKDADFASEIVTNRGLDHGAWNPLILIYPAADIPVTQLSIQPRQDAAYHLRLGQALEPLKEEGVLILASGSATHNLREIGNYAGDSQPPFWVSEFADWLTVKAEAGDIESLINYRQIAPHAERNHPTPEHLLPLFVALGAGGKQAKAVSLHSSYTYGVLSMAALSFLN
jgi:4,5-DOPA dioxygenase extradiol